MDKLAHIKKLYFYFINKIQKNIFFSNFVTLECLKVPIRTLNIQNSICIQTKFGNIGFFFICPICFGLVLVYQKKLDLYARQRCFSYFGERHRQDHLVGEGPPRDERPEQFI